MSGTDKVIYQAFILKQINQIKDRYDLTDSFNNYSIY